MKDNTLVGIRILNILKYSNAKKLPQHQFTLALFNCTIFLQKSKNNLFQ